MPRRAGARRSRLPPKTTSVPAVGRAALRACAIGLGESRAALLAFAARRRAGAAGGRRRPAKTRWPRRKIVEVALDVGGDPSAPAGRAGGLSHPDQRCLAAGRRPGARALDRISAAAARSGRPRARGDRAGPRPLPHRGVVHHPVPRGAGAWPEDAAVAPRRGCKEQLRALPNRGLGYGLLRYLQRGDSAPSSPPFPRAEVSFNYLGQLDSDGGHRLPERRVPAAPRSPRGRARAHRARRPL